jgi:hypothetical protein
LPLQILDCRFFSALSALAWASLGPVAGAPEEVSLVCVLLGKEEHAANANKMNA